MPKQTDAVADIQAAVEADDAKRAEDLILALLGETVVYTFVATHKWPAKCGTVAGYQAHLQRMRDGLTTEPPCQPCKDANTARDKAARAKARAKAQRRRQAVTFLGRVLDKESIILDFEDEPAIGKDARIYWSAENLPTTQGWDPSKTVPFVVGEFNGEPRTVQVMPDTLQIARLVHTGEAAISDYHKIRASALVAVTDEPEPDLDPFAVVG